MESLIKLLSRENLEHPDILKELVSSHRHLAELKGIVHSIPNEKFYFFSYTSLKNKLKSRFLKQNCAF